MHRNSNSSGLVCNGSCNCLTNPPSCIGGELKALGIIELFNRFNQAQVSFLNQIQELHSSAQVTLCNADNQTQVGFGQFFLCCLIAVFNANCQVDFILRRKQRYTTDLFQINLNRVVNGNALCAENVLDIFVILFINDVQILYLQVVKVFDNLDALGFQIVINFFNLFRLKVKFTQSIQNFFGVQLSFTLTGINQNFHY